MIIANVNVFYNDSYYNDIVEDVTIKISQEEKNYLENYLKGGESVIKKFKLVEQHDELGDTVSANQILGVYCYH